MNWEDVKATTKRLVVQGGWLYWVRFNLEEPCMSFVPHQQVSTFINSQPYPYSGYCTCDETPMRTI